MQKKHATGLIVTVSIVAAVVLVRRFLPPQYISGILGKNNAVSSLACSYPFRVAGNSMEPHFKDGQLVFFDKCVEDTDIGAGKIIMFSDRGASRLGIVKDVIASAGKTVYKVVQPGRPDAVFSVEKDQITAVYKD